MKKFLLLLFFFVGGLSIYAQDLFQFNYMIGQRFRIEGYVEEDVFKNDILVKSVQIKNVGNITVTDIEGNRALHEGKGEAAEAASPSFLRWVSRRTCGYFFFPLPPPPRYWICTLPLPVSLTIFTNSWNFTVNVVPSANALTAFNVTSAALALRAGATSPTADKAVTVNL